MKKKTIGREIAAFRETLGLPQEAFAAILRISTSSVSRWERDIGTPSRLALDAILRLARERRRFDFLHAFQDYV